MIDLYVIVDNKGILIDIYTEKDRALVFVKSDQTIEHWQHDYDDGFGYVGDVSK